LYLVAAVVRKLHRPGFFGAAVVAVFAAGVVAATARSVRDGPTSAPAGMKKANVFAMRRGHP
jgi:hypothetical protein